MSKEKSQIEISVSPELAAQLRQLAAKYENKDFLNADPSQFMHRYRQNAADAEVVALFSACLAFGQRKQILAHIERLLAAMQGSSPANWIRNGLYNDFLQKDNKASFYRVFSYRQLYLMAETVQHILIKYGTFGACCRQIYCSAKENMPKGRLAALIAEMFPKECSPLISHTADSASKRLNLFLRWMTRQDSPVDLGVWSWYPASELLMPMDVHVLQTATETYHLLPPKAAANLNYTLALTKAMNSVFPGDPTKADFALFGYGEETGK